MLGQVAHFISPHRETHARISRSRGFHRSVERENIGLKGHFINCLDKERNVSAMCQVERFRVH